MESGLQTQLTIKTQENKYSKMKEEINNKALSDHQMSSKPVYE